MSETQTPPAVRAIVDATSDEERAAAVAALWARVEREGTPLVDARPEAPGTSWVTFVHRDDGNLSGVELQESVSWRTDVDRELLLIPGTDVWYACWPFVNDVRTSYHFVLFRPGGDPDGEELPDQTAAVREILDVQERDPDGDAEPRSILVMPEAEPLYWARDFASPAGQVTEHEIDSRVLGQRRRFWAYTPPGYRPEDGPAPLLVVFDGDRWHSAATVLDNLLFEGQIRPMVALFVQQIDRNIELPCNPEWSRFLVEELLPWAQENLNASTDPADVVVNGVSYGGLASAYNVLTHPESFGNALVLSGSCWWMPETGEPEDYERHFEPVGARVGLPAIIQLYRDTDAVPVRIYHDVGSLEIGPPTARPFQTYASRHFRDIVTAKGYDYIYREYAGGHDDAWWRSRLGEGLIWLVGTRHRGEDPASLRTGDRPVPEPRPAS